MSRTPERGEKQRNPHDQFLQGQGDRLRAALTILKPLGFMVAVGGGAATLAYPGPGIAAMLIGTAAFMVGRTAED